MAEALGYAGGVLAIAAGIYLAGELWPGLSTGAVLAFAAVACVVLGAGGAAVRTTGDPALRRLRSVLWLMSTVSLAAFTGTLADQVWRFGPDGIDPGHGGGVRRVRRGAVVADAGRAPAPGGVRERGRPGRHRRGPAGSGPGSVGSGPGDLGLVGPVGRGGASAVTSRPA